MEPIPKSGYYYSNKMSRLTILALESVMGKNGVNAILNLANQKHLIDNYPPDNLGREFDFADFSAITWLSKKCMAARRAWFSAACWTCRLRGRIKELWCSGRCE